MSMEHPTLSDDQVGELVAFLKRSSTHPKAPPLSKRDRVLVLLMLDAGLRCSEAVQLPLESIIWQGSVRPIMGVPQSIAKYGVGGAVPMSGELKQAAADFICNATVEMLGWTSIPFISLFSTPRHLGRRQAARIVETICTAALGIHVHPHMLRHTFGNRMRKLCDVPTLQNLMRHKNLSSTQVYMHPTIDDSVKAIERLDRERTESLK